MKIKKRIMDSQIGIIIKMLQDYLYEFKYWYKYAYDSSSKKDFHKKESSLVIRAHALEKGMSIGRIKNDFGREKTIQLLIDLQTYLNIGGTKKFVNEVCGIIKQYLIFNNYVNSGNEVEKSYNSFVDRNHIIPSNRGGVKYLKRVSDSDIQSCDFSSFSRYRYSIRDFGEKPIDYERIYRALTICEKTPSACNRQPWRIKIYNEKIMRDEILKAQNGAIGFCDAIQSLILICCDIRCYETGEMNLPYVDGGIYGMNLLYALQYEGLASIPLSLCYHKKRMMEIRKSAKISDNEVPVLLVGVGSFKDQYKVGKSERNLYKDYTIEY